MEPAVRLEEAAKATIKVLFRLSRENHLQGQDISEVARTIPLDFTVTKRVITTLERVGYVETQTMGQKVALTDAGLVIAQRLLR